jgi:hypothetical protein
MLGQIAVSRWSELFQMQKQQPSSSRSHSHSYSHSHSLPHPLKNRPTMAPLPNKLPYGSRRGSNCYNCGSIFYWDATHYKSWKCSNHLCQCYCSQCKQIFLIYADADGSDTQSPLLPSNTDVVSITRLVGWVCVKCIQGMQPYQKRIWMHKIRLQFYTHVGIYLEPFIIPDLQDLICNYVLL